MIRGRDPMMRQQKTLRPPTKRKQFKIKYQEFYFNYEFIATHICGNQLSNKVKWLHSVPNWIYGGDK